VHCTSPCPLYPELRRRKRIPANGCLLYPQKRTCAVQQLMSALGQKRTCAAKQLMSATGRVQTQSDGSVLCCSRQVLGIGRPSGFGVKQVANANS
jgi:hypothetical protein